MMHPKAEQLLQAQLQHILYELQSEQTLTEEVGALVEHLSGQPIKSLISLEHLQQLISTQALEFPIQPRLAEQIVAQIQFALQHPQNDQVKLADLIPDHSVEALAVYLSAQKVHREALIHRTFNNPAYSQMLSQTVSHAINDFMENNVIAKKVPGMGSLMKLGKSVIEKATDSNLDATLQNYLSKNINNLIGVSEKMANRHLSDQQIYQIIKKGWQRIAQQPVSMLNQYVDIKHLDNGANVIRQSWDSIRVNDFLRQQVQDGVAHWYSQNSQQTLGSILNDVNVDGALIQQELKQAVMPIIEQLINDGYVAKRVEKLLREFYQSEAVTAILAE